MLSFMARSLSHSSLPFPVPGTEQALTCLLSRILKLILCLLLSKAVCTYMNPLASVFPHVTFFPIKKEKENDVTCFSSN